MAITSGFNSDGVVVHLCLTRSHVCKHDANLKAPCLTNACSKSTMDSTAKNGSSMVICFPSNESNMVDNTLRAKHRASSFCCSSINSAAFEGPITSITLLRVVDIPDRAMITSCIDTIIMPLLIFDSDSCCFFFVRFFGQHNKNLLARHILSTSFTLSLSPPDRMIHFAILFKQSLAVSWEFSSSFFIIGLVSIY